jgi:hypothetical protein
MKKVIYALLLSCIILLAGCFETTQEITINKDGSGMFVNTTDLSKMVGLLKQMGGDSAQKIPNIDTTVSLAGMADSITGLTSEQKKLINQGTMKLTVNMPDEKLLIKLSLPFKKLSDVQTLKDALPDISQAALRKLPGTDQVPAGGGDSDSTKIKTFDNFYDMTCTDKMILKTLNKAKYDEGKNSDYMKSVQQMSDMGSPITANYVINLPRPAKKVEGKAVKLSDDKKKVTLTATSDDFFNDPTKFEYRIEY